jgi:hypothetical protein
MTSETERLLSKLQPLLSMPRETLPQLTADGARQCLLAASELLSMEFIEIASVAPTFLLLPRTSAPEVVLFTTWHAETLSVEPAAVTGAERLALAAALAGGSRARGDKVAFVVAPGATQGSLVLGGVLREHRERLRAGAAIWPRIAPRPPRRRRIFLGSRGRVVLGVWNAGERNPYRLRDALMEELEREVYGPRPLDFELVHKLARTQDALDFLEEAGEGQAAVPEEAEPWITRELFEPRGHVVLPQIRHPDRPQAWLVFEVTENADSDQILKKARDMAGEARIEMAEGFPWDRISIHNPAIQAGIRLSKEVSAGPEIWPSAPWTTPSGVFTRALGTPLVEWSIPIRPDVAVRFPSAEQLEAIAGEVESLVRAV